ncbi:SigB/SigF/SigG family RNA polymerase sigma factor [Streptomyces oryzae]|uniref:SigB/SigF/SigG family RNA polymerase sigma factor n=1 Tax=Streptomyces oryzae TaxID=1434886 RepID=A0ABS3XI89_9ACTN|nr:SigB/SigF/SigG family RNA polymerase sigma factor [Streptomyces oryzae]MBO8194811.1 SigB/SigF/SigG family RNA polymerase sigma factor [Streptomyces oryzae]
MNTTRFRTTEDGTTPATPTEATDATAAEAPCTTDAAVPVDPGDATETGDAADAVEGATAAHAPRRTHHDAPDTAADFAELVKLPEGCPERQRLQDCVVTAWLPMAHRLARKFRNRGESLEDLEQVAALALVKSVERYDPARGNAFETFAIPTIYGELKRHFRDNMWEIHVPRRVQDLRNRVRASMRELELTSSGRSPTVAELAAHSGLSEEDTLTGMEALQCFNSLSLDAPVSSETGGGGDGSGDGAICLMDTLSSDENGYDHVVDREAVRSCLCRLPEREQRLLYLRFFRELTQSQIARRLGVSQMHVSRLLAAACRRVREEIEEERDQEAPAKSPRAAA